MKKTLPELQYARLLAMFNKLNARLNRHFALGRFARFTKAQQQKLVSRIERMKSQLLRMERGLKLAGSALAIGAAFYSTDVQAQFSPQGGEFQVNTYTSSNQKISAVAMDSDGDFVVVWESESQSGYYGSGSEIYAQRYNASGEAQGGEFLVNTSTYYSQRNPSVAMDDDGDFVISWESDSYVSAKNVYAQRFNAIGEAQGGEFRVNTFIGNDQRNSSIAIDSDGDFVVVWQSTAQDGDGSGIYLQRYNASGVAQGSETQVNTSYYYDQRNPALAMDADGDFAVVWESYSDGDEYGIYGQRYNAAGAAQGSEFLVNSNTNNNQRNSSIAMDSDGDFVVVWESGGQDGDEYGIYGQRYNAAGAAQGTAFLVNTYISDDQKKPSVAMDSDGDFVVTWQSYYQDDSYYGIYAQRYNASGVTQGSEFLVNTGTNYDQINPSAAMDADGDFVVAWQSYGQDGNGQGVFAQRYTGSFTTATVQSSGALSALQLFPNPTQGDVFLSLEGEANINVLDLSGQLVKQTETTNQRFSVEGLQAGVYLIEISQGEAKAIKKLVVK